MKKNLDFLKGIYIAHRGLYHNEKGIPENSIRAFKEAVKRNIPVELDVHLLKDGNIVVFHDDNLSRMTGYNKMIKDCTYEEISGLRLLDTNEKIPLFEEVLQVINGKVLIDIELKYDTERGNLETRLCSILDNYEGKFIVKSFSPYIVKWFKKNRPEYIRGQLATDDKNEKGLGIIKRVIAKNMLYNFITKPDFIAYDLKALPNKSIERYRKKSYPILIWTIRTYEELEMAKQYGDSYIYEKIQV